MVKRIIPIFLAFILSSFLIDGNSSTKIVVEGIKSFSTPDTHKDKIFVIKSIIDLEGATVSLPEHSSLYFKAKGGIVNGVLIGAETTIVRSSKNCFGVELKGSWRISRIADTIFNDHYLSDNLILASISVLQNSPRQVKILLNRPEYLIDILQEGGCGLALSSNTEVVNNSTIAIRDNSFTHYDIIRIDGANNVVIRGGRLIGDVGQHHYVEGSSSEWGHGINIVASKNVSISQVAIEKCIGDGIAITGRRENKLGDFESASSSIDISYCIMDANRRQGISVIHAENVVIRDCRLNNTGSIEAVAPSSGIDVEPNASSRWNQAVKNIRIINCSASGNKGSQMKTAGYAVDGDKSSLESIIFEGCDVSGGIDIGTGGVSVKKCRMNSSTLRGTDIIVPKIVLEDCDIMDGFGVLVYYSGTTDGKGQRIGGVIDTVLVDNCRIRVAEGFDDTFYKGAVAYHGGVGEVKHLICNQTEIYIPENVFGAFNLTKTWNIPDLVFRNCSIKMPGRDLLTRGARFEHCSISCKSIVLYSTSGFVDRLDDCVIDTTDEDHVFSVTQNNKKEEEMDFIITGCRSINKKAKAFSVSRVVSSRNHIIDKNSFYNDNSFLLKK